MSVQHDLRRPLAAIMQQQPDPVHRCNMFSIGREGTMPDPF